MDSKTEKQMSKMVDAVQPHCEDRIIAAMTCSHAGSMSAVLLSKLMMAQDLSPKNSRPYIWLSEWANT